MTQAAAQQDTFGEKIALVGRGDEREDLRKKLYSRGDSHVEYFVAGGGIGKTRLLQELVQMVDEAGPEYRRTPIIDLYHTDNHSTSDIESHIIDNLAPDHSEIDGRKEYKYFKQYRELRHRYTEMRELGASNETLEQMRVQLSLTLVDEWLWLARDMRKLVLIFDTLETLQYESSVVENYAGLDAVDTMLKNWLLSVLPRLSNVLVVFAGRPKQHTQPEGPGEEPIDHQGKLEGEIRRAFEQQSDPNRNMPVEIIPLAGLTEGETRAFLDKLSPSEAVIPEAILPVVHRLTGGAPIFLHLIFDLMRRLTDDYQGLIAWFQAHQDASEWKDSDKRLENARREIKKKILQGIFNEADQIGPYLSRIAMIPKGINADILEIALGMPRAEAEDLMKQLANLSFVKHYGGLAGETAAEERLFLHDEMYQLFRDYKAVPNLHITERQIAFTLVHNYYDPLIERNRRKLTFTNPDERDQLRKTVQGLQVERLYYLLVQDARKGYKEYQFLSEQANHERFVGFSMRLHDELLRFYNIDERRKQFEKAGISHAQIVRESAEMWIERFHWWGQHSRVVEAAENIFANQAKLHLDPQQHPEILGNIGALYGRAVRMTTGYNPQVVQQLEELLVTLPEPGATPRHTLARARLLVSLGFLYTNVWRYTDAAHAYGAALAAFDQLKGYQEEVIMLLNNLSYLHAQQGRFDIAELLIMRALRLNKKAGTPLSFGLTHVTRASIELLRGSYRTAIEAADDALGLFNQASDPWGKIQALRALATAHRKLAKLFIRQDINLDDALVQITQAGIYLEQASQLAETHRFQSQQWLILYEKGKVYRERGRLALTGHIPGRPAEIFDSSEEFFNGAVEKLHEKTTTAPDRPSIEEVEILVDLAELLFFAGLPNRAADTLAKVLEGIQSAYLIERNSPAYEPEAINNQLLTLGKVERLQGEMDFSASPAKEMEGLEHFYKAALYFNTFFESAPEKRSLNEYLSVKFEEMPVERRRELVDGLQQIIEQHYDCHPDLGFVETLRALIG